MTKWKIVNLVGGLILIGVCIYGIVSLVNMKKESEETIDNDYKVMDNKTYGIEHYKVDMVTPYEKAEEIMKEGERLRKEKEWNERMEQVRLEKERLAELERKRLAKIEAEKKKKEQVVVSRGSQSQAGNWRTFNGSYYGMDCNGCSGKTAYGLQLGRNNIYYKGLRVIAVDPSIIRLGSIVEVKTPNETFKAIAGDTGGAIKGFKIDILVESEAVSTQYGRHNVQVRVLKTP